MSSLCARHIGCSLLTLQLWTGLLLFGLLFLQLELLYYIVYVESRFRTLSKHPVGCGPTHLKLIADWDRYTVNRFVFCYNIFLKNMYEFMPVTFEYSFLAVHDCSCKSLALITLLLCMAQCEQVGVCNVPDMFPFLPLTCFLFQRTTSILYLRGK